MFLYYITNRTFFPGNEVQRRTALVERVSEAARSGVDFIQLREKDLTGWELESLAREALDAVRAYSNKTRVLVNSRSDIALATKADGVHLPSSDISVDEVRGVWQSAGAKQQPIIALSCHSEDDVIRAAESGADLTVFGPVFEKANVPVTGLEKFRAVTRHGIPVLALGGVSVTNAASCLEAGADGIAGIRLFQQGKLEETVAQLRSFSK